MPPHPPQRWSEPVDSEEAREILADLQRLRDRPPPTDPSSAGCTLTIVAIIALVLMPFIGRGFQMSGGAMLALGIGLAVTAVFGGLLGFFGGGLAGGAVIADVERALEELVSEFPDGDEAKMRRAAVRVLDQSMISRGPTSVHTFEADEVVRRLGPALDYVLRIERFLLEQGLIHPSLTMLHEPPERPDR